MPGRTYSAQNSYRYGFNGKENDNEVKGEGNQQDYGMRIYDPRLGRFLSVDPLKEEYADLSTYQFSSNSPISNIDLDGAERLYYTLSLDKAGKPSLKLTKEEDSHKNSWTGKTEKWPLTYIVNYGGDTYTFFEGGGRYENTENSTGNLEAWCYLSNKGAKVPGFTELFYSDKESQVELLTDAATEWAEGMAAAKSMEPRGEGTIYEVPGEATPSGKPYIGRHNQPEPSKTRSSSDGRDRTKAKVVDKYNKLDPKEGQYKEQKNINAKGGIQKLDNKRNEVNPKRMEELEKLYGGQKTIILPKTKAEKAQEKAKQKEEEKKKEEQKTDDLIKYHG